MAKLSELQSQDPIELRETGGSLGRSDGREDSDSFALRQAGKKPVLRVSTGLSMILLIWANGNLKAEFQPPVYVRLQLLGPWYVAGITHVSRPNHHYLDDCWINVRRTFGIGLQK